MYIYYATSKKTIILFTQQMADIFKMDDLITLFYQKMQQVSLDVYGILDSNNRIHTLGTDSKIIGRIFEMLTQPV